ncbi:MAG: S-methyl-5-thioribose-1-phosphate isomerase [Nevskiaceae bacterium]|nr:MAG: S-methyl-5-thioribose-1-phosphate isomerase [Nevskiaceae bacterium]TBR74638.1 MAG: S-methyl-5-thioribose-1-phosphate isomerase [Nevskiaceae bacterium]
MNSVPLPTAPGSSIQAVLWSGNCLRLLDQRLLPETEQWLECWNAADVAQAIHDMVVRGAPAIGIAAGYGVALAALAGEPLEPAIAQLAAARPTAVNLGWSLARMQRRAQAGADAAALVVEAQLIHAEDVAMNQRMGELGATLIKPGSTVLTHCNTGALATGGHGTALGVIRTAWRQHRIASIYHTETRPWLQGARLTAWELKKDGLPACMIVDSAVAHLMHVRGVDWVVVGADRIAANGDTANKIGTYQMAVAARAHGARFMVVAPTSTFDRACPDGGHIPIEERSAQELTHFKGLALAPEGTHAYNPVFDVTPATLINAIVCERGVVENPDTAKISALFESTP